MSFPLGIGIVTYNRKEIVAATIDRVRQFTGEADAVMVVADDGSSDGTLQMLRDKKAPVITGVNMGIAWNKNRALFLLCHMLGCETVILLEDDTQPAGEGWEQDWMRAATRWGHANYAADWMTGSFESGAGTPDDPVVSRDVTAQCAVYSRAALTFGGYFDPKFRGYGHEHVEHSRRLLRVGYGGTDEMINGQERVRYYLIKSELAMADAQSHCNAEQGERNLQLARVLMAEQGYRAPWGDDREMRQFRSETQSAMSEGPDRFRIRPNAERMQAGRPGMLGRLFIRA